MNKRSFLLIFPVIAVLLELLPQSVVMNFADYDAETGAINVIKKYYSYFNILPFGYGNFFPLICACATCAVLLSAVIYLFTGKHAVLSITGAVNIAAVILSVLPVLFKSYTLIGLGITLVLAAELVFVTAMKRSENNVRTESKGDINNEDI